MNTGLNVVVQSLTQFGLGRNGCWPFRGSKLPRALPSHKLFFRHAAPFTTAEGQHAALKPVAWLLSSLARLRLLLLLMRGNVHPNPGSVFPCSVCAGNVTWQGSSVQCCTCFKWVHLKCSLLSSKFRILGTSHSWSCCFWSQHYDFSGLYTCTVQSGNTPACKPLIPLPPVSYLLCTSSPPPASSCLSLHLLLSPPDSLRVLQWNARDIRAKSTELLLSLSSHPVNLICIQESNLNSSSSPNPRFSAI